MPQWTDKPPTTPRGPGLPLRRTPQAQKLQAIVTTDNLIGCPTHYFRSRTIPCEQPNCEPCNQGFSWRWHGYLAALDPCTHEHFLFEFTAQAADAFRAYRDRYGTLRGCLFQARRLSANRNGRVLIQTKPANLEHVHLPPEPDIKSALCHIWNIPRPDAHEERLTKGHPRLDIAANTRGNHPATPEDQRVP